MDRWWGEQVFEGGETVYWRIGPRDLWVTRLDTEWWIATRVLPAESERESAAPQPSEPPPDAPDVEVRRFAAARGRRRVIVGPALPDRPLVVSPVVPIFIPPSESLTLYVSTPLWLRLFLQGQAEPMIDEAIHRPSDTWFGPDTTRGALCYSSRTTASVQLDALSTVGHRAVAAIQVENRVSEVLEIKKMSVPVAELSLSSDAQGRLWTDRLTLRRDDRTGAAVTVAIGTSTPEKLAHVSEPRAERTKGSLFDAFANRLMTEAVQRD